MIIAATNHPKLLDRAVFRRFGIVIHYPLPTTEIARDLIRSRLSSVNSRGISWRPIDEAAGGLSHAEITLAAEQAAKQAILSKAPRVSTDALVAALEERRHSTTDFG